MLFAYKDYPKEDVLYSPEYRKYFFERKVDVPVFPIIGGYLENCFVKEKKRKRAMVDELQRSQNGANQERKEDGQSSQLKNQGSNQINLQQAANAADPRLALMAKVRANTQNKIVEE